MTDDQWRKVCTTDYYQRWESLEPKPAKSHFLNTKQEPCDLYIRWPDLSVTKERLVVEHGNGTVQIDMNNFPDHFETQTFFVIGVLRGLEVKVPLRDLEFHYA